MLLPFTGSDSGLVYSEAAAALLHGDDWAKQALVGALEYPTLPLLIVTVVGGFVQLLAPVTTAALLAFLIAGSQAVCLLYLWRAGRLYAPAWTAGLIAVAAFVVLWWPTKMAADPRWLMMVPGVAYLYHAIRLERYGSLRDLAIAGLCGGMLGLALALFPLANWLVMGDPLFFVKRLGLWGVNFSFHGGWLIGLGSLAVALVVTGIVRGVGVGARLAVFWSAGLLLVGIYGNGAGVYLADYVGFCTLSAVAALFGAAVCSLRMREMKSGAVAGIFIALLALPAALVGVKGNQARAAFTHAEAPEADEMLALIDKHWEDSRILIYDLRSAALYAGHESRRFVPNLDYNRYVFAEVTEREQMHLLVPPNNHHFYSGSHPLLASAHAGDMERLFPEKIWPSDWQLWRCVRPLRPEALGDASGQPATAE
jgi:hypothetical protein